ncbi:unnamed protein product [Clavelina lepadiformis]|uniref:Uncharacterized protein n=1 Tax=Clavelina lepadiformis TaxID=159417 RepID=A0ABP0G5J0_CLALP
MTLVSIPTCRNVLSWIPDVGRVSFSRLRGQVAYGLVNRTLPMMMDDLKAVQSSNLLVISILVQSEENVEKHLSLRVDWRYRSHKLRRGIYPRIVDRAGHNSS